MERQQQILIDPFGTVERFEQENSTRNTTSNTPLMETPTTTPSPPNNSSTNLINSINIPNNISPNNRKKRNRRKRKKRLPKAQQLLPSYYSGTTQPSLQQAHGDILRKKNNNTTRLMLNNPRGIYCSAEAGKTHVLIDNIITAQADVWVGPESHVKPGSDGTKTVTEIFKSRIHNCTITHSNTRQERENSDNTQAGGVSTFISPTLTNKLGVIRQEPLGRWHTHEIFTQKGLCILYSLYRVNPGSSANPHSAYSLLLEYHKRDTQEKKTPDKQVVIDLVKAIKKDIAKGRQIIIMADANESHGHSRTDYLDAMRNLGLISGLEKKFGYGQIPPTQKDGKQGIDHVHYSPELDEVVLKIGILKINEFCDSDHCCVYLDIDNSKFLAPSEELITFFDRRRLKSPNIKSKYAYLHFIDDQITQQNVKKRIDHLQFLIDTQAPDDVLHPYIESLDKQLHEIMIAAEKKLPGAHTMYWTPEVTTKLKELYGLNKEINQMKKKTKRYQQNHRHRLHELNDRKKVIKEWFQNRVTTADEIRQTFLDELAQDLVKRGRFKEEAVAIKCLKHIEQQKSESKILSSVLKPFREGGLSYILIPGKSEYPEELQHLYMDPDTIWMRIEKDQGKDIKDWIPITLKHDMERLLLAFQKLHFQQAQNTPLASPTWVERLKSDDINNILPFLHPNNKDINKPTKELLKEIITKPEEEPTFDVSFDDFKRFVDKKDERTSASPSGRHYGHLKSVIDHDMLKYIYTIIEASVLSSYIPERWKRTITTLVAKDPEPQIHRLRPIHIIEPEMQFISNHFWTKVFMRQCEKLGLITDAQYGGRSGRQPQNAIIKQQIIWDMIKLKNMNAASHLADARANFDRNMSHIVGKALISLNMDPHIVRYYQQFLKKQNFSVKTSYGTTTESYTYDAFEPHFGDGQGIGWSSVNQIIISSVIDAVYNALAPMFQLKSFDDLHTILSGINFFIDDRISNTLADSTNIPQLIKKFQSNENLQVDLLNATGGAIAPKKCVWWLLQKEQGNLGFKYKTKNLKQHKFRLKNCGDNHWYEIDMLQPEQAEKYLGAWIGPEMDPTTQIKKLEEKIQIWSRQLLSRKIPARLVTKAYNEYLKPSMAHPLVACDLTYDEADKLMRKIRTTLHEKTRYHSKTALEIQHGPIDLFGEALTHIFDIAGEEKLAFLFSHLRNRQNKTLNNERDTVAEAILTSLKDHQLWLGHFDLLFNIDFDEWQPLLGTRSWIISLWRYICFRSLQIDINEEPIYELPAENDFFLMKFLHKRINNMNQKKMFNKVRVHYHLLTLSDIVDDTGKQIHPDLLNNSTDKFTARESSFNWPDEEYIKDEWRSMFKSILQQEIEPMLETNPLGPWIEGRKSHQTKTAILLPDDTVAVDNKLYQQQRANQFKHIGDAPAEVTGRRVDIKHTTTGIKLLPTLDPKFISIEEPLSSNILDRAPTYIRNIWGLTEITEIDLEKLHDILQHPFIIVSDGGCPQNTKYCTYAWAIAKPDGTLITMNGGAIGGLELDNDSFRAEGYGVLAGISFINFLESNGFNIHPHWKQYCDNKTCTELDITSHLPTSKTIGKKAHYDIRAEVQHELNTSISERQVLKVKGHMDKIKPFHLCLPEEKINILVDAHCTHIHRKIQEDTSFHPPLISDFLPHQYISLRTSSHRLVKKSFMESHEYDTSADLTHYICNKLHIDDTNYHNIDWKALSTFSASITQLQRRKYQKILHRKWLTHHKLHQMKQTLNGLCPLCSQEEDSFEHILKCKHTCLQVGHENATENFLSEHFDIETPDDLALLFIHGIKNDFVPHTLVRSTVESHPYLRDSLNTAVTDQNRIGWKLAISGLLSRSWAPVIQAHFTHFSMTQRRVETWMRKTVGTFMNYAHTLWCARQKHLYNNDCNHISRLREECKNLHADMCKTPWKLGKFRYHLDKSQTFFDISSQKTLDLWKFRVSARIKEVADKERKRPKNTLFKAWNIQSPPPTKSPTTSHTAYVSKRELRAKKERNRRSLLTKIRTINHYFNSSLLPLSRPSLFTPLTSFPDPRPPPEPDPPDNTVTLEAQQHSYTMGFLAKP